MVTLPPQACSDKFKVKSSNNSEFLFSITNIYDKIQIKAESEDKINLTKKKYIKDFKYYDFEKIDKIFTIYENIVEINKNLCEMVKKDGISVDDSQPGHIILKIPINFGKKKEINLELSEEELTFKEEIDILRQHIIKKDSIIEKLEEKINILEKENLILNNKVNAYLSSSPEEGDYIIYSALNRDKCFDYLSNDGNELIINKYEQNKQSQIFKIKKRNKDSFYILNNVGSILDFPNNFAWNLYFQKSHHYKCNQLWKVLKLGELYCLISDYPGSRCAELQEGKDIDGTKFVLGEKNFGMHQLFIFKKID